MSKKREVVAQEWKHNQLAEDLGISKGTNFFDVPLGSVVLESPQRADVIEVKPSYTRFCVSIYEIKVSRADFQSDIRTGKYKGYLDHCHRFYFACPSGMVDKSEIPEGCGLIVRGDKGWSSVKAAKARDVDIPPTTLLSLIFSRQRINHGGAHRNRLYETRQFYERKKVYKLFGKEMGEALRNKDDYFSQKGEFEYLIESTKEKIKEGLGIETDHPTWRLADLVREIKRKASTV